MGHFEKCAARGLIGCALSPGADRSCEYRPQESPKLARKSSQRVPGTLIDLSELLRMAGAGGEQAGVPRTAMEAKEDPFGFRAEALVGDLINVRCVGRVLLFVGEEALDGRRFGGPEGAGAASTA